MIKIAQIYKGIVELEKHLVESNFDFQTKCLVKIITDSMDKDTALQTAKDMKQMIPNGNIVGMTSASAVIYNGEQLVNETIVIIEVYKKLHIKIRTFSWENKSAQQVAEEVHNAFCYGGTKEKALVNILFSDTYYDVNDFLDSINELTPMIQLAGGIVGDLENQGISGFIFTDTKILENSAIAFVLTGEKERHFIGLSTSMETISPVYEITKVTGSHIDQIENQPALTWMYEHLNIAKDEQLSLEEWCKVANDEYLVHFPLLMEGVTSGTRFVQYLKEEDTLSTYFSKLPNNSKFRVGYIHPKKSIQEGYDIITSMLDSPIESLFVYSCLFRKTYLQNCSKWELTPYINNGICGIFTLGEILYKDGKNTLYNGGCAIIGVSEQDKYIIPSASALEKKEMIDDDVSYFEEKMKKYVLKNGMQKSKLFQTLEKFHLENSVDTFFDANFGLPNIFQYDEDSKTVKFDKVCMLELQTAETIIALAGEEKYYEACRDIIKEMDGMIYDIGHQNTLFAYSVNYKTVALVSPESISEEVFMECVDAMYTSFEYVTSKETDISGVTRFAVVVHQQDMINVGMNTLFANKESQDNFFICDKDMNLELHNRDELVVINLLKRAIDQGNIIPYYQGIHNNSTRQIDKYEALMRIVDTDGKIYTPYHFMDIAKKHKFYNRISQMMIGQVLTDFSDRPESVSINISLYDIVSPNFREWFINKLKDHPTPERVIIEFVETEDYAVLDTLVGFIEEIHNLGVKIAIDDFGAGYSTLSAIVALKPDFLKIDGSIVSKIANDSDSRILLDSIQYLAGKMGTKSIAEYVENGEIQDVLETYGILYSQGYFFSKPAPFVELKELSTIG